MAWFYLGGAEFQSAAVGVDNTNAGGSPAVSTSVFRSGTASYRYVTLTSGNAKYIGHQWTLTTTAALVCARVYLRFATLPGAENRILLINDANSLATPLVYVTVDDAGLVQFYDEDGQITGNTTITTDTWYRFEIEYNATGGASADIVGLYVDGVEVARATNRELSANPAFLAIGMNLASEANTTGEMFADDIAIRSVDGLPGAGEVIVLRPDGDSATDWTGSDADSTDNYLLVDEVTPNTTDYAESGTLDQVDDYTLEATPAAMESGDTINAVGVGLYYALSANTGGDPSLVLRITYDGTTEESSGLTKNNNNQYSFYHAQGISLYPFVLVDLPGASSTAWTKAALDATGIGARISVDDTDVLRISAIWLAVDHKPGAGGGGDGLTPGMLRPMGIIW
jgi:hypothetical protein